MVVEESLNKAGHFLGGNGGIAEIGVGPLRFSWIFGFLVQNIGRSSKQTTKLRWIHFLEADDQKG